MDWVIRRDIKLCFQRWYNPFGWLGSKHQLSSPSIFLFAVNSLPSSLPFLSSFFFVLSASPPPSLPLSLRLRHLSLPSLTALLFLPCSLPSVSPLSPSLSSHPRLHHLLLTVHTTDSVIHYSQFPWQIPSLITHRSHCTVRHPLLTVYSAQSAIHYSPCTLHSPSSITHRSHWTVRHPLLTVHSAQSVIHYSPFTLHNPSPITHRSHCRLNYSLLTFGESLLLFRLWGWREVCCCPRC